MSLVYQFIYMVILGSLLQFYSLYYIILSLRINLIESMSDTYQKYLNQIQFLKKQINGEKIAHQNTLKQLQSTYQIIDQMKDVLRLEQTNNFKLKSQLADKNSKIMTITNQYEEQIRQIKEMINLKDEELRRMSSVLMVTDYDVIRLKVVNELQMIHREEVQKLSNDINARQSQNSQLRSNYSLLVNKNSYLKEELKKQIQQLNFKLQKNNEDHIRQVKNLYQSLERQRNQNHKWNKKLQLQESKNRRQIQSYKQQISKLNKEIQVQNVYLLSNNPAKLNKNKLQKMQGEVTKLKEEIQFQKDNNQKSQEQIKRLRKELRDLKNSDYNLIKQKDKLQEQLQYLKKQIQSKQSYYLKQMQKIKRQSQDKKYNNNMLERQDKQSNYKIQFQNKKLIHKIQLIEEQNKSLKQKCKDNNLIVIKKQLQERDDEIQKLLIEISNYKKKENQNQRSKSFAVKKDDYGNIKTKLNEANNKIVDLLREKIQMKQQITQLKQAKILK